MAFVELGDADRLLLDGVTQEGVDYSRFRLPLVVADGSRLVRCKFEGARLTDSSLGAGTEPSTFIECSFDGSRLTRTSPGRARFVNCSFQNVKINEWRCGEAEFINCVFSGTITSGFFSARVMHGDGLNRDTNEYVDNDFGAAQLISMDFRGGVDLTRQVLPRGPEYVYLPKAAEAIAAAKVRISRQRQGERQEIALIRLDLMQKSVDQGQRQLLLTPWKSAKKDPDSIQAEELLRQVLREVVASD